MPKEDLYSTYDVIHGSTDISDVTTPEFQNNVSRILRSPQLERLRGIKQLGFVSRGYPAADHSRYGHAVGSLQMMRKLFRRIRAASQGLPSELLDHMAALPGASDAWEGVGQHLLLSAVLQDIGELPYHQGTKEFFSPAPHVLSSIAANLGTTDFSEWSTKEIFTIGALLELLTDDQGLFAGVDLRLLTYLITGHAVDEFDGSPFQPLRHMVDGVVDADRLDYVFRDGHHTIGYFGSPDSVIDSILGFDAEGPIFSEPAPVSRLLLMRAHLYSTVYLSPADRFQNQLLKTILSGVQRTDLSKLGRNDPATQECEELQRKLNALDVRSFLKLDDAELMRSIDIIQSCNKLDGQTRLGLRIFLTNQASYESVWVTPSDAEPEDLTLPEDLFFDAFTGKTPRIYRPGSVRVQCSRFSDEPVYLEETSTLLEGLAANDWSPLPKPFSILLFRPKDLPAGPWQKVEEKRKNGKLHSSLLQSALKKDFDTWDREGFMPPNVFISFCSEDWLKVLRILALLADARQCSLVLAGATGGYGSPAENSIGRAHAAGAYLLVMSRRYVNRLSTRANRTLSREFDAIAENVRSKGKPYAFLNLETDCDYLRDGVRWHAFGGDSEMPVIESVGGDHHKLCEEIGRVVNELRRGRGGRA